MDVQGGSTANGAHLIQFRCTRATNQRFRLDRIVSNVYQIRIVRSGKCLDVQGGSNANGAHLSQFRCTGNANQRFDGTAFVG